MWRTLKFKEHSEEGNSILGNEVISHGIMKAIQGNTYLG